jgi:hypothetical protein
MFKALVSTSGLIVVVLFIKLAATREVPRYVPPSTTFIAPSFATPGRVNHVRSIEPLPDINAAVDESPNANVTKLIIRAEINGSSTEFEMTWPALDQLLNPSAAWPNDILHVLTHSKNEALASAAVDMIGRKNPKVVAVSWVQNEEQQNTVEDAAQALLEELIADR